MINIIITISLISIFVILTRLCFYLVDYFKSIQKPKFLYFKQITFELLVSTSIMLIFVSITVQVYYAVKLIEYINKF